jgi:iron complex transport system ATP-binding protein
LDPGAREKFLASLRTLGRQKKVPALVYVTHHVEEILPMFKKTLILKEGRVLASGKTSAMLKPGVLEKLYGVSLGVVRKGGRYWPIVG